MGSQANFTLRGRNPDVLSCIASLSNDEVFTPPELANKMLDAVAESWARNNSGANIWANKNVRFLDPSTKSGVFLREITSRLTRGLEKEIPDIQERVDHILMNQVYGLGMTQITALLARRSVYCSKDANGEHSIAKSFKNQAGNIWFERTKHTWEGDKCRHCGGGKSVFDRSSKVENHAYAFIHTENIKDLIAQIFAKKMQFDVIIGNPPYQMDDGGHGASAVPIYNKFVEQAKALDPKYLTMIIPSRWLFGGRGLDEFRREMLSDRRIRLLHDYPDSRMVFPSVDVAGGVCYFLWDRDNPGDCNITEVENANSSSTVTRPLLENGAEVFIRNNRAIPILKKVMIVETGSEKIALPEDKRFDKQVSSQKPFGLRTFYRGKSAKTEKHNLIVLQSGGRAYASRDEITAGNEMIDKWKVFTSKSSAEHAGQADKNGQRKVLSLSGVIPPASVITETYVLLGVYDTEKEARNCYSYVATKFFRFLIAVRSSAQDLARSTYSFVPIQDFSMPWTDEMLYKKYKLSKAEIDYIEGLIRPMSASDE
jgi:site-specific DNA-methyltransferase (adenine-specific)